MGSSVVNTPCEEWHSAFGQRSDLKSHMRDMHVSTERPDLIFRISLWKSMSEWTIQSTIRLFFEKWNSVKKCPRYVWIQKSPKMAFFSAKNQEILKMSHFYLNELSLTIRTGFLWVNVTIWHWVCSNIPKIKDFRGYHPSFGNNVIFSPFLQKVNFLFCLLWL